MQLVEQGKLSLDDAQQVETIAPELRDVKVLEGDLKSGFRLVEKQRKITLRMLLNHTGNISPPSWKLYPPQLLNNMVQLASDTPSPITNSHSTPSLSATTNSAATHPTSWISPS